MNDDTTKNVGGDEAQGSGLTRVRPGESSTSTDQGGTGASQNAREDQPDSARERVLGGHEDEASSER